MTRFEKMVSLAIVGITGFVPLILTPFLADRFYSPKFITIAAAVFVVILANVTEISKRVESIRIKSLNLSIVLLLVYLLLTSFSLFFSVDVLTSITGASYRYDGLSSIILYGLLTIFGATVYRFHKNHAKFYAASVLLVAAYGIIQKFGLDPIKPDWMRENWINRSYSTMGNPNFLGSYLVLALPVLIYGYIKSTKRLNIFLPAMLAAYFCLLCTNTRGSWLGGFMGVAAASLLLFLSGNKTYRRKLFEVAAMFTTLTGLYFFVSSGFLLRVLSIFFDLGKTLANDPEAYKSGSFRIAIWRAVLALIAERPFTGYGLETMMKVVYESTNEIVVYNRSLLTNTIDKAHNEYLHVAFSCGIFTAVAFVAFQISVLRNGLRRYKSNEMIIPLLGSIFGYMIGSLNNISIISVTYIFWIFCGILLSFCKTPGQEA